MERVQFLEDKRLELTNIIQNLSSSSHKETLENQINKMEMKLITNCSMDTMKEKVEVIEKKNIKCRSRASVSIIMQTKFVTNCYQMANVLNQKPVS